MTDRGHDCDLHPYIRDPDKARAILDACIQDCRLKRKGLVRVVHGKGKGNFRALIHSHLDKHADVEGFILCDPMHGGSGATWVHIHQDPQRPESDSPGEDRPEVKPVKPVWRWLIYLIFIVACMAVFAERGKGLWIIIPFFAFFIIWLEYRLQSKPKENRIESDSNNAKGD